MKINQVINEDVRYSKQPLDLRYQRTYAVKVSSHTACVVMLTDVYVEWSRRLS